MEIEPARLWSARDAEREPQRAASLQQPGDLMPVDAVGVDLGQRSRDAQTPELCHTPVVHGLLLALD
jgi:hypothetical protein